MLIVGAGPAGGDLARRLAVGGIDVLLVDRLTDLRRAAFSSAALPLEAIESHGLPSEVVASRWSGWQLIGPGSERRCWSSDAFLGAVLDFGALRRWLAEQTSRWGGRVQLGLRAASWRQDGGRMRTRLQDGGVEWIEVESDWLVDATGQSRSLLGDRPGGREPRADPLVSGAGVEWLLEVPTACWERWADRLSFCLGSDWVPQGYGWIFPMAPGVLKAGVCRLADPTGEAQPPLGSLLEHLLARLLEPEERSSCRVLDRHGGLIRSRIRRREAHRLGRLIGLGDAVSTANLLGGEGIRHALTSSGIVAPLLRESLARQARGDSEERLLAPLGAYPLRLRRALGWRWSLSGRLARRTWLGLKGGAADRRLEHLLTGLQTCRAEDLSALLFGYRFERYGVKALPYLLGWR